ncbi:hypothetical protein ABPG72_000757 [Tetrahymena utriculariae]
MEIKLQYTNKQKNLTPSMLFQQLSDEENKSINEIRDIQSNRSSLRQQFEIQNSKPQKLHEGDIQISYQSIQGDFNESFQKSLKEINNNIALSLSQQPIIQVNSNKNYSYEEQTNCLFQSKQSQSQAKQNKIIQWPNLGDNQFNYQEKARQQLEQNILANESSQNSEQHQQVNLYSQNNITKNQNKKCSSIKDLKCDDKMRCNQNLIQDEIIYEKDLKKLGTRNFLQSNNEELLQFFKDENLITDSSYSQNGSDNNEYEDEEQEQEEEEDSQIQMPFRFEEKPNEINLKNSKKILQSERIEKQAKSINKINSILTSNEDFEQLVALENQIQSFHSNLIYENQEFVKAASNTINSQARMKSFEATDSFDSNNFQEPQNLNQQKSGYYTESNKVNYKKDTKSENQHQTLNQDEEDESIQNNCKKLEFQKPLQKNTQLTDYLKSQIKQGPCYNKLNKQICKYVSSQSMEDNSQIQAQDSQILKSTKIEGNKSKQKISRLSIVKKESTKNQLTNQNELRSSIEQMILQNIVSMSLLYDKRNSQASFSEKTEARKSFIQDSQFLTQNSMDYFDKMQQFRKYYPKNNFDKILSKLRIVQQQQKKQKKVKLASRERRQNIAYVNQMTLSILQENTNFMRLVEQDYDLNLYKPTNLSYGIKMLQGVKYPINNTSKSRN